jgi:hypothetical protein
MKMPGPQTVLSLQQSTETASAFGTTTTWVTEGTVSGVLTKHSGVRVNFKESVQEGKLTVMSSYTFFCDVPTYTITEKKRFILGSRTFNIIDVYSPGNCNHHFEIELQEMV